jgi:hypothetical protein
MFRSFTAVLAAAAASACMAQTPPPLVGTVEAGVYTPLNGSFKIEVPVLPELGGGVHDTENVVTFRDNFGLLITIAAFPQDATQRWELSTRGNKDYLIYFFTNFVLADFKRFFPNAQLESAGYSADFMEGALFTYVLLPGGSSFADREVFTQPGTGPVAKRGNLCFVKNGYTFVISSELSERVTEGSRYNKTSDQENQILRQRLLGVTKKMQFPKPREAKQP